MFNITHRKPTFVRIILMLALLLVFIGVAVPAGATKSQELVFTFTDVTYYDLPARTGYGNWTVDGLMSGSGTTVEDPNHSGWDPDGCWRAVHSTDTLTDSATGDTITIRTQVTKIDGTPYCFSFTAEAHWVILSGTGAYSDLHGQGDGTVTGYLDFQDDGTVNYVLSYTLKGDGHND